MSASRTDQGRTRYEEYVARVVAAAPPLSAQRRLRLRELLGTAGGVR